MHRTAIKYGALVALLLLLTAGYLALVAADAPPSYDYTIQTSGTPGLKITGNCTINTATGPLVKDFSGAVGRVEHVKGTGVTCHLHKAQADGDVKLLISQDGNVVSETESAGSTTDIDASVSVS